MDPALDRSFHEKHVWVHSISEMFLHCSEFGTNRDLKRGCTLLPRSKIEVEEIGSM